MSPHNFSRRQFLQSTTRLGITLTLTSALSPAANVAQADEGPYISILGGLDILEMPDIQDFLGAGTGALWVSGSYLNTFAHNLNFNNLPPILKLKYQFAGSEFKGLPAAEAIWKTIPAPIRAGGPEALWKFHQGKDWSHIIPKAWGGPTTAENGIWWSSAKNKSLGPNPMSPADIADAKAVLRTEAIRATIVQTLSGMVRGAMLAVVVGGVLACLECGLEYAEGKIAWREMMEKILERIIIAGAGALIVTGLIVGISLLFPFLIPVFLPVIVVLQIASLVFLGQQLIPLAKGWWEVLNGQELLDATTSTLENVWSYLRRTYKDAEENVLNVVWDWVVAMADRIGLDNAWESAIAVVRTLGIERAWAWFAAQTHAVAGKAAGIASTLNSWDYDLGVDMELDSLRGSIATVITSEFQDAISTTEELLRSIRDYRKNANQRAAESLLVA